MLSPTDLLAIHQLYAAQAHAIDGGDARAWASTFAPKGTFTSPTYGRTCTGSAELTAFAEALASSNRERRVVQRHWSNQLLVDPDGAGARARCYAQIIETAADGVPRSIRSVVFLDRLTRTEEGWRFAARQVTPDVP